MDIHDKILFYGQTKYFSPLVLDNNGILINLCCTVSPTNDPTIGRTINPTKVPTSEPTSNPTYEPTQNPTTEQPSSNPTNSPTPNPTNNPSLLPSTEPTFEPSSNPTLEPTETIPQSTDETYCTSTDQLSVEQHVNEIWSVETCLFCMCQICGESQCEISSVVGMEISNIYPVCDIVADGGDDSEKEVILKDDVIEAAKDLCPDLENVCIL